MFTNLQAETDYETNGELHVVSKSTKDLKGGSVQELKVELALNSSQQNEAYLI